MKNLKLTYFSPTGTTAAVLRAIAGEICENNDLIETIDLTSVNARKLRLRTSKEDLLLIGVPVYMGRVPALLNEWLDSLEADGTPTVCIVVYGNRAYEDALLELSDIVGKRGANTIAGAAFIGEHSFSSAEVPTAQDRPDCADLELAREFGRQINKKMNSLPHSYNAAELNLPGNRPYGGITKLWDVDFIAVDSSCTQCGLCSKVCPMEAVSYTDSSQIDHIKCISCCACIKKCPQQARQIKPGPVKEASFRLNKLYQERKEPEFFI